MGWYFLRRLLFALVFVLSALSASAQRLPTGQRFAPTGGSFCGIAVASEGQTVSAMQGGRDAIGILRLSPMGTLTPAGALAEPTGGPKKSDFPSGVALNAAGTCLCAADTPFDSVAAPDVPQHALLRRVPVGGCPLAVMAGAAGASVSAACKQSGTAAVVTPGLPPDALCPSPDRKQTSAAKSETPAPTQRLALCGCGPQRRADCPEPPRPAWLRPPTD